MEKSNRIARTEMQHKVDDEVRERLKAVLAQGVALLSVVSATRIKNKAGIYNQIYGDSPLSIMVIKGFATVMPELSLDWLITGRGRMLSEKAAEIKAEAEAVALREQCHLLERELSVANARINALLNLIEGDGGVSPQP